jgi:nitrogen fixation-related uncharacterized protein
MQPVDAKKFDDLVKKLEGVLTDHQTRIVNLEKKTARTPPKKKEPEKTVTPQA